MPQTRQDADAIVKDRTTTPQGGEDAQRSPAAADDAVRRAFLTPRVVDQRTFEELSGSLRTLVRDAAAHSRALAGSSTEVKLLGDQLREATRELQAKVEAASRVVPGIDARVAKAEQVLDAAGRELTRRVAEVRELTSREVTIDKARVRELVESHAAAVVDEVLGRALAEVFERRAQAFEERLGAIVDQREREARARLDLARGALEDAAAAAEVRIERVVERAAQSSAELARVRDSLEETCQAAEQRVQGLKTGLDASAESVADAQRALEESLQAVELRLGALMNEAGAAAQRVQASRESLDIAGKAAATRLGESLAEAQRTLATIDARAAELASSHAAAHASLTQATADAREAGERLESAVREIASRADAGTLEALASTLRDAKAAQHRAVELAAEMREIIASGERTIEAASHARRETGGIIEQCDRARESLGQSLVNTADRVDSLSHGLDQLREECERLERLIHEALTKTAPTALELAQKADKARMHFEASLAKIAEPWQGRAEQMGQSLAKLVAQADAMGRGLDMLLKKAAMLPPPSSAANSGIAPPTPLRMPEPPPLPPPAPPRR